MRKKHANNRISKSPNNNALVKRNNKANLERKSKKKNINEKTTLVPTNSPKKLLISEVLLEHDCTDKHDIDEVHSFLLRDLNGFLDDTKKQDFSKTIRENILKLCIIFAITVYDVQVLVESARYLNIFDYVLSATIGLFVADLIFGFLHLYFDHVKLTMVEAKKRPFLEWVAFGFQWHHVRASNWNLDHDLLNYGVLRTGISGFIPLSVLLYSTENVSNFQFKVAVIVCSYSFLFAQVAHAAAHNIFDRNTAVGKFVRVLQDYGILVHPAVHHLHHTLFDTNWCIITGWAQPLINGFYRVYYKNVIDPEMSPEIQRQVYIIEKKKLKPPYYQMFPEWRRNLKF